VRGAAPRGCVWGCGGACPCLFASTLPCRVAGLGQGWAVPTCICSHSPRPARGCTAHGPGCPAFSAWPRLPPWPAHDAHISLTLGSHQPYTSLTPASHRVPAGAAPSPWGCLFPRRPSSNRNPVSSDTIERAHLTLGAGRERERRHGPLELLHGARAV